MGSGRLICVTKDVEIRENYINFIAQTFISYEDHFIDTRPF